MITSKMQVVVALASKASGYYEVRCVNGLRECLALTL